MSALKKQLQNNKAFTLIELMVVMVIVGTLVLLATPRFIGQTEKAREVHVQNDVAIAESVVGEWVILGGTLDDWTPVNYDYLSLAASEESLYGKDGLVKAEELPVGEYAFLPQEMVDRDIRSELDGTFYAYNDGTVYYDDGEE